MYECVAYVRCVNAKTIWIFRLHISPRAHTTVIVPISKRIYKPVNVKANDFIARPVIEKSKWQTHLYGKQERKRDRQREKGTHIEKTENEYQEKEEEQDLSLSFFFFLFVPNHPRTVVATIHRLFENRQLRYIRNDVESSQSATHVRIVATHIERAAYRRADKTNERP